MMNILVWDDPISPAPYNDTTKVVVLWCSRNTHEHENFVSIPDIIDRNSNELRSAFLSWVYDIGEIQFFGGRLVDFLKLRENFSYWWLSITAEKCNFDKSPQVTNIIRLIAFADYAIKNSVQQIELESSDVHLASCLRNWCRRRGMSFCWRNQGLGQKTRKYPYHTHIFFHILKAIAWLIIELITKAPLYRVGKDKWNNSHGSITVINYCTGVDAEKKDEYIYSSPYWGKLPEHLSRSQIITNWIHIYSPHNRHFTPKKASSLINFSNRSSHSYQNHTFLHSFITVPIVCRVIFDWFVLVVKGLIYCTMPRLPEVLELDFWPLLKEEIVSSLFGIPAVNNILNFCLFEQAFKLLPAQASCVYLLENQGWEIGMQYTWRKSGHGLLIGCPHSTVRYWDLRYFFDPRCYYSTLPFAMPQPDKIAVNGPAARRACEAGGYPISKLVDVEALRFQYLNDLNITTNGIKNNIEQYLDCFSRKNLLVLCDYTEYHAYQQLLILAELPKNVLDCFNVTVRPHPTSSIDTSLYRILNLTLSCQPIEHLLAVNDIAFTGAVTSAAVDAYCSGLPVISILDSNSLNMSPLLGLPGVRFISSAKELVAALFDTRMFQGKDQSPNEFFNLDPDLPRWKNLLQEI